MKNIIIFIFILIVAFIVFIVFSYMEQFFLGIILAAIIITWPFIFWIISKVIGKRGKEKEEEKRFKQDIIDGDSEMPEKSTKESETKEETEEEEFVVPPKKDVNVNKAREDLEKLKKASEILDEEKDEGILSGEIYNELKRKNEEAMEKLEQEIAKAGGEIREKKVYCRKGKHYVSLNICLPSKIKGYVICPEHNEEIRVE